MLYSGENVHYFGSMEDLNFVIDPLIDFDFSGIVSANNGTRRSADSLSSKVVYNSKFVTLHNK